jgi:chromosomal replication initiation ATPase DnaA
MTQQVFELWPPASGRSDFLVSACNAAAIGWIERWPAWPTPVFVLHGPAGCGKTHLLRVWCERAGAELVPADRLEEEAGAPGHLAAPGRAIAVDDAERAGERSLLHLYNAVVENGGSLLLTARRPPGRWPTRLDDLRSRLRAAAAAEIGAPDDALLGAVLVKHFADRRVPVAPGLVAYLARRIERSFAAALDTAAALDRAALAQHRPVTIALAREVLDQLFPSESDSGTT